MGRLSAFLLLAIALYGCTATHQSCTKIDNAFSAVADPNDTVACRCYEDGLSSGPADDIWIGCNGHTMSSVFSALSSLNGTMVSRVHIWDSIMNIIPSEMFEKVRPQELIIERSALSVVRKMGFSTIGSRLKELHLRNNIIKRLDSQMLFGLDHLKVLDISGNKLTELRAGDLDSASDLRELILNENDISRIEDGTFAKLTQLRTLSIAGNKITTITREMFKGLDNLEVLRLQNNQIGKVDWSAFKHMKQLKHLDFGTNHLSNLELRGLDSLEKLILNNNSIQSLKNVSLRDLPSLLLLSVERNLVSSIGDSDLFGLAPSTKIESISLAANNISSISPRALSSVQHLGTLALQNNKLTSLSYHSVPFLRPLKRLHTLVISGNLVTAIREAELPSTIQILAADHNHISHIDGTSFTGMAIRRVYLNNNMLTYLSRGTFDTFNLTLLEAIDLTSNQWQCVCGEEWLGKWLEDHVDADVGDGPIGCLATRCPQDTIEGETHSTWVTVAASILAAVSLLIIVAIAYLVVEDGRHKIILTRGREDSDLHKLISDVEPIDAKTDADRGLQPRPRQDLGQKKSVRFQGSN